MRFDPKIPSLEEREDLDSLSMEELHGIFVNSNLVQYLLPIDIQKKNKKDTMENTNITQRFLLSPNIGSLPLNWGILY
jgi:hypothetical protein